MTTTTTPPSEGRPGDSRPAFERIAYTWLDREVDGGQRLDPGELAAEVSVAPRLAAGLLARLRAAQARDPEVAVTLRGRRARDRITDAYVTRELHGNQRLDPAQLAAEAGVSATVARQWLHALRTQQDHDGELAVLAEPPARSAAAGGWTPGRWPASSAPSRTRLPPSSKSCAPAPRRPGSGSSRPGRQPSRTRARGRRARASSPGA